MGLYITEARTVALAALAVFATEQVAASDVRTARLDPIRIHATEQVADSDTFAARLAALNVTIADAVAFSEATGSTIDSEPGAFIAVSARDDVSVVDGKYEPLRSHRDAGARIGRAHV